MGKYYQTGRGGNNGHPVLCFLTLPSMAMSPWAVHHFISEMTGLYATAKTAFPASPLPSLTAAPLLAFPGAMRSAEIDFLRLL